VSPFRSLYGRLATALLGLLLALGVFYVALSLYTTRHYIREVNQKLHQSLAKNLVAERILVRDGEVDQEALEHVFHVLMVVNPQIEVYLLDPDGGILAYSAPPGRVRRERVSLGPVHRFLEGTRSLPILGDDPRDPDGAKAFSVAPISLAGADSRLEGYLYVVLGGEEFESVARMLRGSYILKLSLWVLGAGLCVALAAGLGVFGALTRRLSLLTSTLDRFRRGRFEEVVQVPAQVRSRSGDEIDRLADSYVLMADRIIDQVGRLQATDRLRRELVANVSHDLRTPLAALQGYLQTLSLKPLPPEEQRRYLEIAVKHSERLGKLVSQLFELAKLDSEELRVKPERFSVAELAQDVVHELQLAAETRGVRLEAQLPAEPALVEGDIELIERVFANLIDNALRYTSRGGTVRVEVGRDADRVRVDVSDTGCGIPADELERIFERFQRGQRAGTDDGGSGLGLAIAKKIVELHSGTIEAESAEDRGTTFRFRLPLALQPS